MNTGGPAFPIAASTGDPRDGVYCQNGMTLLDWYAGQALPWCLSEFAGNAEDGTQYAEAAYQIAAAMLAEKARRDAVVQQSSTTDNAAKVAELQAANKELVEALDSLEVWGDELGANVNPPSRNCSCHINPPCNDCVDFTGQREAKQGWEDAKNKARAILAKHKGAA